MKPIPAIVETAAIDVDLIDKQIAVALAGKADAERTADRHEQLGAAARETAKMRRLEIGQLLCKVRPAWPERGPNAKGWGVFLAKHSLDDATARRYMDEYRDPNGFAQKQRKLSENGSDLGDPDDEDDAGPREDPRRIGPDPAPPFRQPTEAELVQFLGRLDPEARKRVLGQDRANVKGGSGEPARGTWCTSRDWAIAVGPWDLDPFSNPRSHIASVTRCMLEDGGDAFGGNEAGDKPGLYLTGNARGMSPTSGVADELTRVWIQPPFELVASAIAHYGHTRFCALLRWSPDVKAWFPELWRRTAVVCQPYCERMEFEPPPGVDKSGDMPFPHALYYAHEADVTEAVLARCIVWRVNHDTDDARLVQPALHIVH